MPAWLVAAWPGLCAVLLSIGIGRFAYTPILPFLISGGLLSEPEAAHVGAANLVGYLVGAVGAARLGRWIGTVAAIRLALAAGVVSLAACALPLGFGWYAAWRCLMGIAGAVLMILAPSAILARAVPESRGRTGGVIYTGIGLGAVLSSLVVAPLAARDVSQTWAVLALAGLLLTLLSWRSWAGVEVVRPVRPAGLPTATGLPPAVWLILAAYTCDGAGFVPHTIFWVDFIDRGLGRGPAAGAFAWLMFGVGAATGPMLAGFLGDRVGLARMLVAAFGIKAAAVFIPLFTTAPPMLALSSLLVGALSPGMAVLITGRIAELLDPALQTRVWGLATLGVAGAQAIGGLAMSVAFTALGEHRPLYVAGGTIEAIGMVLALAALRRGR